MLVSQLQELGTFVHQLATCQQQVLQQQQQAPPPGGAATAQYQVRRCRLTLSNPS